MPTVSVLATQCHLVGKTYFPRRRPRPPPHGLPIGPRVRLTLWWSDGCLFPTCRDWARGECRTEACPYWHYRVAGKERVKKNQICMDYLAPTRPPRNREESPEGHSVLFRTPLWYGMFSEGRGLAFTQKSLNTLIWSFEKLAVLHYFPPMNFWSIRRGPGAPGDVQVRGRVYVRPHQHHPRRRQRRRVPQGASAT